MIFARRLIPHRFSPSDWDAAWARGWFRMRQTLFTTSFLEFERQFHSAVWLRVGLQDWVPDRTYRELAKRNADLRVEFAPLPIAGPSDAEEELYQRYRKAMPFEPAPTLKDLLYGDSFHNVFPSWTARLYDGDRLVAGGIFDLGDRGAAGITSYYDPDYRKRSLGKYLIYLKMLHCRDQAYEWWYPGYAAPGETRFDYKWSIGASTLEYFDLETGLWLFRDPDDPVPDPLRRMEAQLVDLRGQWAPGTIPPALYHYLHLDINLNPQVKGMGLFDYPVFLDAAPVPGQTPSAVVVHEPRDGLYHLLEVRSVYRFEKAGSDPQIYDADLLTVTRDVFSSEEPEEVADVVAGLVHP